MPDIGAKIGIDGEKAFRDSLGAINSQLKNLGNEMKSVVASFAGMEDSEESVSAKSDVLQRSIQASADKINLLQGQSDRAKKRLDELAQELNTASREFGQNSAEALKAQNAYNRQATAVNKLESQINQTTAEMKQMERQMAQLGDESGDLSNSLRNVERSAGDAGDMFRASFSGNVVANAVSGIVSSMMQLSDETAEYRKIMGTLEVSSQKAGYSAEQTKETYNQLNGILGDNQTAATATANLQALGLEQEKLKQMTDGAIGAWATYGDSIPIDGLSEAINETVQAGKVTGTFADVLNWAGTSEDEFNAKLAAAATEAERADIILQEMANQGLMQAAEGWRQNNEDILAANQASSDLEATAARLGGMVSPMVTEIKEGLNGVLSTVLDMVEEGNPLIAVVTGLAVALAGMGLATFIMQGGASVQMLGQMATAFRAVNTVMMANPILLVVSLLAGLTAALVTAYQTNEEFRAKVDAAWESLKTGVGDRIASVKEFVDDLKDKFFGFVDDVEDIPEDLKEIGRNIIEGLWNGISEKGEWLKGKVNGFVGMVKGLFTGASGFDTHSPSKWSEQIGGWVMEGLGKGMAADTTAEEAAKTAAGNIKSALGDATSELTGFDLSGTLTVSTAITGAEEETVAQNFTALTEGMTAQEPILTEYLMAMQERMLELISGYEDDYIDVGEMLMEGVSQGVKNGQSGLVNSIAIVLAAAVRAARRAMDINSPSGVFEEIGGYMGEGLNVGWLNSMKSVKRNVSDSMTALTKTQSFASAGLAGNHINTQYSYGDIIMNIGEVNNANDRDTRRIAEELEFVRRQREGGKGGSA